MYKNRITQDDLAYITRQFTDWDAFANKSVLVSGAYGFLPAYLILALYHASVTEGLNIKITGIVRDAGKARVKFRDLLESGSLRLLEQDVCDPLVLEEKADFIVHAASYASPKYYGSDPVGTLRPNILGTHGLLEVARQHRSESFLFFSSGEVYGEVDVIPTPETGYGYLDPMDVRSCYAESKRMAETMCVAWYAQYGVPVKIVRPFHTYGPGMSLEDGRVFSDFVADVIHKRDIVLKSDGLATRTFCYLADATLAFLMVLVNGVNAHAYNVSNDTCEIAIRDLAELMAGLFPEYGLKVRRQDRQTRDGYIKSNITRACPDIGRIRALGWDPVFGLEKGFRRTVESYL